MYSWGDNIKKRRLKQIQSIKHGQLINHDLHYPKEWMTGEDTTLWKQKEPSELKKKWMRRLTIQTIFSMILLVVTYLALQVESSSGRQAQAFITEAFNRPFNFQGMTAWYQEHLGTSPTILPAFKPETKVKQVWYPPVTGKIVLPFNQERNGLVLRTKDQAQVVAPADGWVTFAGQKEGLGQTVIIQHPNGKETWLSLLGSFSVQTKQWVKKGEKIGRAGQKEGQSFVYIALKQGDQFLNPTDVIPFD